MLALARAFANCLRTAMVLADGCAGDGLITDVIICFIEFDSGGNGGAMTESASWRARGAGLGAELDVRPTGLRLRCRGLSAGWFLLAGLLLRAGRCSGLGLRLLYRLSSRTAGRESRLSCILLSQRESR